MAAHAHNFTDLTGRTFGRLKVLQEAGKNRFGQVQWLCLCECGVTTLVTSGNLGIGHTTSCGCLYWEASANVRRTHGKSGTPTYSVWRSMLARCNNPRTPNYAIYGGRGITVCERWLSFKNFLADIGERPSKGHSLDRYPDKNGNYEPGNVRWATAREQQNNKRNNLLVTVGAETLTVAEWARRTGTRVSTIRMRLKSGWTPQRAVQTPPRPTPRFGSENLTVKQLARRAGVSRSGVQWRLAHGWTAEEAGLPA